MAEKIRDALIFSIATIGWCWSVMRENEFIFLSGFLILNVREARLNVSSVSDLCGAW